MTEISALVYRISEEYWLFGDLKEKFSLVYLGDAQLNLTLNREGKAGKATLC